MRWGYKSPLYRQIKNRDHENLRVLENHPKAMPCEIESHFVIDGPLSLVYSESGPY